MDLIRNICQENVALPIADSSLVTGEHEIATFKVAEAAQSSEALL
jgi:hypothetical protein